MVKSFICFMSIFIATSCYADEAKIAKEASKDLVSEKTQKGAEVLKKLFGRVPEGSNYPADFTRMTVENVFGDLWQGTDITIEERSIITCAMLVALGRESEQRLHFTGARNLGIERKKIEAVITQAAHYAGWPVALSAFNVLNEVWPVAEK